MADAGGSVGSAGGEGGGNSSGGDAFDRIKPVRVVSDTPSKSKPEPKAAKAPEREAPADDSEDDILSRLEKHVQSHDADESDEDEVEAPEPKRKAVKAEADGEDAEPEVEKQPRAEKRIQQLLAKNKQAQAEAQQLRQEYQRSTAAAQQQIQQFQQVLHQNQVQMAKMAATIEHLQHGASRAEEAALEPVDRFKRDLQREHQAEIAKAREELRQEFQQRFAQQEQQRQVAERQAAAKARIQGYAQEAESAVQEHLADFDEGYSKQNAAWISHYAMNIAAAWNKPIPDALRDWDRAATRYVLAKMKALQKTNGAKVQASQKTPKTAQPNGRAAKAGGKFNGMAFEQAKKAGFAGDRFDFMDLQKAS